MPMWRACQQLNVVDDLGYNLARLSVAKARVRFRPVTDRKSYRKRTCRLLLLKRRIYGQGDSSGRMTRAKRGMTRVGDTEHMASQTDKGLDEVQ